MDPELLKKIEAQEQKLEAIYQSVERLRKYFLWTLIVTLITIFLPLLALGLILPSLLSSYSNLGL